MPKPGQKKTKKLTPLYYISTVLMVISLLGILFFVGKNVIPFIRANQLEKEIPKPQFNTYVKLPVTFSVLSASAVASPLPETENTSPEDEHKPLTDKELRAQTILKEAEKQLSVEDPDTVFEDEEAPINEAFKELLEINPDTVGWLKVGEIADYPVVKRDNDFYLLHNFKGEYDTNGTIFITQDNVLRPRDTVLLIFGHHMNSGKMFGKLVRYMHEDYMREFPLIQFHTIYADEKENESWYIPVSFFSASMEEGEEGYFDVLPMFFETEKEHDAYLKTIKERSVWKAPTDVTKEDNLIMLITCSYDLTDSRYLLICRQLREDETPEEIEALYQKKEP